MTSRPRDGLVMGIETSCDETAVAIVRDGRFVESNIVASQTELHSRYGGVMPEQASRAHLTAIVPTIRAALTGAGIRWDDLLAIGVTHGPGLAGSLLVGLNAAKGAAFARSKPLVAVNHLHGHIYANWLRTTTQEDPEFPSIAVIVSGGHSELALVEGHGVYRRLGRTRDDAPGEAFDKVARMLGLGFPGGPEIERMAAGGDPSRFAFPRAWLEPGTWDVSFSGLKTAVLHQVRALAGEDRSRPVPVADLAASFQAAVVDILARRAVEAARQFRVRQILLGGGVAANQALRARVQQDAPVPVHCPPPQLATDNGAMIASAAYFQYRPGMSEGIDLDVIPGLPLA